VRNARTTDNLVKLIMDSFQFHRVAKKATKVRVHESGDYFTFSYFKAWMIVASMHPQLKFYSYTKSLHHLLNGAKQGLIPNNFTFTASYGGQFDHLIQEHKLKNVTIVMDDSEAIKDGRPVDHDDSHALAATGNFSIVIHGGQRKGTIAAKVWDKALKKGGAGYNRKRRPPQELPKAA
jgi:hypothetical protein